MDVHVDVYVTCKQRLFDYMYVRVLNVNCKDFIPTSSKSTLKQGLYV